MAISTHYRPTLVEQAARNIDRDAIEVRRRDQAARQTAERIAQLRHVVFCNAARGRHIEDLRTEADAARLLISADNCADGLTVLAIVQVAMDNRWSDVVRAGIRYFGEHPVAARIHELWTLTTHRSTA
ncbi:hypothetical protein JF710_11855 [Mycobacterium intracellulare]|uniref:hypothetical protein n=1 Tax=Mycobacterium intracellulare TaxID=1767 RepID=UPI001CDB000C|nr:hypothetical protein [Mycobacterium intracellulare]MCA2253864.1 hypothetical protein [Mycobacterium intracellulare]